MAGNSENSDSEDENWQGVLEDEENTAGHLYEHAPVRKRKSDLLKTNLNECCHSSTIVHIDIDCFYAQVEMIRCPQLKDIPLGIQQKNIIVTCNYVARQHGVTKLMYLNDALKKCPQLHIVNGENLTYYREMSYKITALLSKYSGSVERLGFDENYINVTEILTFPPWNAVDQPPKGFVYGKDTDENCLTLPVCQCGCTRRLTIASHIAADMRKSLYEELGITSCAGVGSNKLLAKLVGETHKPNQQTVLLSDDVNKFMLDLQKLRKIPGIGQKTSDKLAGLGITSIKELQTSNMDSLVTEFGEQSAKTLTELSFGIDPSPVVNTGQLQSMSDEDSFKKCDTVEDAKAKMLELVQNLLKRLEVDGRIAQTLRVTVRKLVQGVKYPNRQSRQGPISPNTFTSFLKGSTEKTEEILLDLCFKLFQKVIDTNKKFHLTLINVCFANLVDPSVISRTGSIENFLKSPVKTKSRIETTNTNTKLTSCEVEVEKDSHTSKSNFVCENTNSKISHTDTVAMSSSSKTNTKKQTAVIQSKNTSPKTIKASKSPQRSTTIKGFFQQSSRISSTANQETENIPNDLSSDCESLHASPKHTNGCISNKNKHLVGITNIGENGLTSDSNNTLIQCTEANATKLYTSNTCDNIDNGTITTLKDKYLDQQNTPENILFSLAMDNKDGQFDKVNIRNNDIEASSSVNNSVKFNSSVSVKYQNSLSPENYRLLVQHLGSCMDLSTFLELPKIVQEDIILQQETLSKDRQQILLNIIRNKCTNDTETKYLDTNNSRTYSDIQTDTAVSSCELNVEPVVKKFCKKTCNHNRGTESVPPGIDPGVFKELPKDVQKSLYNDWKTKSEFETMRKRKISSETEMNKNNKKRTSFGNIKSFFQGT